MKWFDRKFEFDLAPWMFPNVVERVRGTPARLEERIHGLSTDFVTRRDRDHWSIQEHVGHLWDLEPLWAGRIDDIMMGTPVMRPADLENRKTHEANHNAAVIGDLLQGFRESRLAFVSRLDGLEEADILRAVRHPRLDQPMRMLDLAFFVAEHDDHHLAEITRLIGVA